MMPKNEYEFVEHNRMNDLKVFVVDLSWRNLHMHREFELCLVLSGRIELFSQRATFLFSEGELLLLNPKQPHELHAVDDTRAVILSMQVSPRFCIHYYPQIHGIEFDCVDISRHLGDKRSKQVIQRLKQLAATYFIGNPLFEFACHANLNEVFHALLTSIPWHALTEQEKASRDSVSERLGRILEYLEKHFTEKLLLADIAEEEGLSLTYLSHYFRDHLNMTFQEYLSLLRFEEARSLIANTGMSMTDISMASGFSDSRYLNAIFREKLGMSPAEYRTCLAADRLKALDRKESARRFAPGGPLVGAVQRMLTAAESLAVLGMDLQRAVESNSIAIPAQD